MISYSPELCYLSAELRVPFARGLRRNEARALADDFAKYLLEMTFEEHEVVDCSSHLGTTYLVRKKAAKPIITWYANLWHAYLFAEEERTRPPNYKIIAGIDTAYIRRTVGCSHDHDILEAYAPSEVLDLEIRK